MSELQPFFLTLFVVALTFVAIYALATGWPLSRPPPSAHPAAAPWQSKTSTERQDIFRAEDKATQAARWAQTLRNVPFPFEIVAGAEAEAAWETARADGQAKGYSPLIINRSTWLFREPWPAGRREQVQRILASARPASEFFDRQLTYRKQNEGEDEELEPLPDEVEEIAPPARAESSMSTAEDYDTATRQFKFLDEVALIRIPTPHSWEMPAHLLYGDFDGTPKPEEMVAVAKHWHEKYGAEICGIGGRTLEFRVARPPTRHEDAVQLWREHMLFCEVEDRLPEDTPHEVASLRTARYWLFVWD
jgi:pimeloyl-ACP methyl ester carboxylesterase